MLFGLNWMPAAADRKQRRETFPDEEQGTEPLCRFAPEAKPHPARDHSGCGGNAADLILRIILTPAKTAANAGSSAAVSETAYREQLETQLTELIEQLDGAGKTVVMVTLESGEERSMLWIRSPARCRTRRPMFCWRMAPPWKRRPICLPSACGCCL